VRLWNSLVGFAPLYRSFDRSASGMLVPLLNLNELPRLFESFNNVNSIQIPKS
jgi:hypothetical protein